MSAPNKDEPSGDDVTSVADPDEYGGLSVEDDPEGTIDPAELAGTASSDDADVS